MRILLLIITLNLLSLSTNAQISLSGNVGLTFPKGVLDDNVNKGYGGTITFQSMLSNYLSTGLNVGVQFFSEGQTSAPFGIGTGGGLMSIDKTKGYFVPITGLFHVYVARGRIKPYIGTDLGVYIFHYYTTSSVNDFVSSDNAGSTEVGIAPVVGIECGCSKKMAFELNAKYNMINGATIDIKTSYKKSANYIGVNAGFIYYFIK